MVGVKDQNYPQTGTAIGSRASHVHSLRCLVLSTALLRGN